MFRHLSETETAEFKQWAWDNWTPGDDIRDGIHHPVVVAECQLIKAAADAWQRETRSDFYRDWDRQADRAESDNYWGSFEHAGRVFDLCAYWTGGKLAVVVYECFKQGIDGYYRTDTSTEQHLHPLAIQKLQIG